MNSKILRILSTGYLLISTLLFLYSWFRIEYAIFFLVGHVVLFTVYAFKSSVESEVLVPVKSLLGIAAIAFVWTLLMGVGGFFAQTTDYVAHNTKFYELFLNKWPITFDKKETFACYYYGYYLVPGLLFKIVGDLSIVVIVAYTCLGIFLGLIWLYLLLFRNLYAVVAFLLCGGVLFSLKLISYSLFQTSFGNNPLFSLFYQSIYVPNQTIPALICSGMFLFYLKDYRLSFYPITLAFYWGVFPALLLILVFGIYFLYDFFINNKRFSPGDFAINYFAPCLFFIPTFIYLTSSDEMPVHGFYNFTEVRSWLPLIEIVILAFITLRLTKSGRQKHDVIPLPIIISCLAFLGALLTYRLGVYNDLFMRGSMPLFFILLTNIFKKLYTESKENSEAIKYNASGTGNILIYLKKYPMIIIWVIIGSLSSLYQIRELALKNVFLKTYEPLPYKTFPNSYEVLLKYYGEEGANQYLGDPLSFYYLNLAPEKISQ
ncbi:hypothetical protein [Dyadobacter psychrotolerans]|uniref:Glycosyltransferase RgtA/B/C/D-like domain-containing protein n=1 Tax=Dyadobacter psychrotolerans TaxID=2541721 RepID=A0A4R5E0F3_9BACT|nr:hypothetical protein [Dyadobacter psychrotolerans]TDE18330.1 hypothetical protein E0F88_01950 [Dyadobacter psychrotolerans]